MKKHTAMSAFLSFSLLTGFVTPASVLAAEPALMQDETAPEQSTTTLYDHSRDTWFSMGDTMSVESVAGDGKYFKGYAAIDNPSAENTVKNLLAGNQSFTFEVVYKVPAGDRQEYQQIVANGDHGFTLRDYQYMDNTNGTTSQVVGHNSGAWTNLNVVQNTSEYQGKKHTVIAGYDSTNKQLFYILDGGEKQVQAIANPDNGLTLSNYALTLGGCAETGRDSTYLFKSVKLFTGAKTAADLNGLTVSDAALWISADDNPVQPVVEPELDYSLLQTACDDVKGAEAANFQANDAWTALSDKLEASQDILDTKETADHTQDEIDAAASALNQAWLAVRLSVDPQINPLP